MVGGHSHQNRPCIVALVSYTHFLHSRGNMWQSFLSTETALWMSPDSLKLTTLAKSILGGSNNRAEVSSCGKIHLLRTISLIYGVLRQVNEWIWRRLLQGYPIQMLPSCLFSEGKRRDPVLSSPYCVDERTGTKPCANQYTTESVILLPSFVDPVSSAPVSRKCCALVCPRSVSRRIAHLLTGYN